MRWARLWAIGGLVFALGVSGGSVRAQGARPGTHVCIASAGWVPRLGARLGPEARVVNLGVSGSTLAQALDEQLGPALDAQPDIVTVWLAVNDLNARVSLDRYAA